MPRYIDADALISSIKNELWDWQALDGITATSVLRQTITDIQNMPTVEVVRCKDCKHWDDRRKKCNCSVNWGKSKPRKFENDYCSHAERKEKTNDDM